jgi:hypothetical protein
MPVRIHASTRPPRACGRQLAAVAFLLVPLAAGAATLSEKARESGCVNKPVVVEGTTYKCYTESGAYSYFNVPGGEARSSEPVTRRAPAATAGAAPAAASPPASVPRVDAATQRGREDMLRKVLSDELAAEQKLLGEARAAYGNGAPAPLPEEKSDADKYRQRIGRLRQAVELHERNIEALKRELGAAR